jgi:hypothetical protein
MVDIEYAFYPGTGSPDGKQIALKLRNAPAWVRSGISPKAAPPRSIAAPAKPQREKRFAGWVAGCCAPGVSRPAFSHLDRETLPEQFTPAAWESIVSQVRSCKMPVSLTWKHGGPVLAVTPFDLTFRMDRTCGLVFEARLKEGQLEQLVIDELDAPGGLAVSVAYRKAKQWIVERDGVGRVRVVNDCVLDHVALIPRAAEYGGAYPAARAYGAKGNRIACPMDPIRSAEIFAFRVLQKQAGATR